MCPPVDLVADVARGDRDVTWDQDGALPTEPQALPRLLTGPVIVGRAWIQRVVAMEGIDRAVVLGAQAFTALFPLLIVYSSAVSTRGNSGFAERLIARFEITGASADSLRHAFTPLHGGDDGVTAAGMVLVVLSALAFTRALQRLYERAWQLEPLGLRATGWGLLWLGVLTTMLTLRVLTDPHLTGIAGVVVSLAIGTLMWAVTPFLLLARRMPWHRLVFGAVLTAVAMLAFSVIVVLVAPRTFGTAAASYGLIGVAFTIVGWLVSASFVVMASTALGAVAVEVRRDMG
jgi:membrane protein